jgi:hypothetical protein
MTGWVWASVIIGLAIVACAVGIPYFLAHKRMRSPYDVSDSRAYIRAKRRWRRRKGAASAQRVPARDSQGTAGSMPTGEGPWA